MDTHTMTQNDSFLFTISPSIILLFVLVLLYILAITAVWFTYLYVMIKFLITLGLCIHAIYICNVHALRCTKNSIVKLYVNAENEWIVTTKNNRTYLASLAENNFISPLYIIANFHQLGLSKNFHVMVSRDAVSRAQFRNLKRILKFG